MNAALKLGIKASHSETEVSLYRDLQNKNGIQGIIEYLLAFKNCFWKTIYCKSFLSIDKCFLKFFLHKFVLKFLLCDIILKKLKFLI